VSVAALGALFNPASMAIVGASDRLTWSATAFANWREHSGGRPVYLVNPRHAVVHGERAYRSLGEIGEAVDLAFVMVGTETVGTVVQEAAEAGVPGLVVLSAGFSEVGARGAELERKLVQLAADRDMVLLGPNAIGFINAGVPVAAAAMPINEPLVPGPVSILLESGGLAGSVLNMAQARAIGLSHVIAMGNQAAVDTADVLEYLVRDEATRCIALFLESVRDPGRFRAIAREALAAGKAIVALKAGRSEVGGRTALAHTGAVAGDGAVTRAALASLGVVVVDSLEDLLTTAGLLGAHQAPLGRRVAVVAASGGACELIADRAADLNLRLPPFPAPVAAALERDLPGFSHVANPLDVTGYVVVDPLLQLHALEHIAAGAAGVFDQIIFQTLAPKAHHAGQQYTIERYQRLSDIIGSSPVPVLVQVASGFDLTGFPALLSQQFGLHMLDGIEHGMTALGHAVWWHETRDWLRARPRDAVPPVRLAPAGAAGIWAERQARDLLAAHGVPLVPARYAPGEDEAVEAAADLGGSVVLKLAADGLAHKSDIGGIALDLRTADEIRCAARELLRLGTEGLGPGGGLIVSPMRKGGVELLVSVRQDPTWGPVLAVGLGGIWVELYRDVQLAPLPVQGADVDRMLGRLRAAALFAGARGGGAVDLAAARSAIVSIATVAERLGDALEVIEINPLWVSADRAEALDALVVWRDPGPGPSPGPGPIPGPGPSRE
jgi:acetate---CoA ligase (ADP-forming)